MSPVPASTLPIIDIAPFLRDDQPELRASASAALHAACVKYGFFYLNISAYADPSETLKLTDLAREFFALPQEEKDKISLSNEDHARGEIHENPPSSETKQRTEGYARLKENVTNGKADNHEGIDFYKPVNSPDKSKPVWGENQWPVTPTEFKDRFNEWVEKMKALGLILMQA